jgi:hypothetical protein
LHKCRSFCRSPTAKLPLVPALARRYDEATIKAVEEQGDKYTAEQKAAKSILVPKKVSPKAVKPPALLGAAQIGEARDWQLSDCVVCLKDSGTVPFGLRGTIVGFSEDNISGEVVFDRRSSVVALCAAAVHTAVASSLQCRICTVLLEGRSSTLRLLVRVGCERWCRNQIRQQRIQKLDRAESAQQAMEEQQQMAMQQQMLQQMLQQMQMQMQVKQQVQACEAPTPTAAPAPAPQLPPPPQQQQQQRRSKIKRRYAATSITRHRCCLGNTC